MLASGHRDEPERDQVPGRGQDPQHVSGYASGPVPPHSGGQGHLPQEVRAGQVRLSNCTGHRHQYLDVLHHTKNN